MSFPEQIDRHEKCSGYRRELKKRLKRLRRRQERRDPEAAIGKNRFRGYSG